MTTIILNHNRNNDVGIYIYLYYLKKSKRFLRPSKQKKRKKITKKKSDSPAFVCQGWPSGMENGVIH